MHRLSLLIVGISLTFTISAQNPHGADFKANCLDCHTSEGWKVFSKSRVFNHDNTLFPLTGQHTAVNCRLCHTSLVFTDANSECMNCHVDIHSMSVGNDCERCHSPKSWLVNNIPELHEAVGFPLIGAHGAPFCYDCHKSESQLRWDRIGNECINCHINDYNASQNPNHKESGFSTDCILCHEPISNNWGSENFHYFFPLIQGHDIKDCNQCHTSTNYSSTSSECVSCHQKDYDATIIPTHKASNYSTDCLSCHESNFSGWDIANFHLSFPLTGGHDIDDCKQCHTNNDFSIISNECVSCHKEDYNTANSVNHLASNFSFNCLECHTGTSAWQPAEFRAHDSQYFPIYTGRHSGTWETCTDCHINANDYGVNSCIVCHTNRAELDREHSDEGDYRYADDACFNCHPRGENND